jgi:hypothetical protein
MKLYKNILITIIIVALSSCSFTTNSAEPSSIPAPDIGIEVQNEKYLEIIAPNGWNSFKTNEMISLEIRNISEQQIAGDPDFGARIFVRIEDEWIEVNNKIVYENDPFTLDPAKNYDPLKTASIVVLPDLSNPTVTSYIRIFVVGTLIEDGKETKKVGSYIDLELKP